MGIKEIPGIFTLVPEDYDFSRRYASVMISFATLENNVNLAQCEHSENLL